MGAGTINSGISPANLEQDENAVACSVQTVIAVAVIAVTVVIVAVVTITVIIAVAINL